MEEYYMFTINNKGDLVLDEQIFDSGLDVAEKMQFSHIVEYVCDLSDIIENIADKIQNMLITGKA